MSIKLIDILREQSEDQELKTLLKKDYSTFVKELGDNIKDPKFIEAIKSLASENPIDFKTINVKVSDLEPTQNEVDVNKSLKFPLTNPSSAKQCLDATSPIKIAGKPIITGGGGKFIIDGHHRWSQVYALNPNAEMVALDLTAIKNPIKALKATQLGIAADLGRIETQSVEGSNLLQINENQLKGYVQRTITSKVVEVFKTVLGMEKLNTTAGLKKEALSQIEFATLKALIANYIWKNIEQMQQNNQPVDGAPPRGIMPQTDDVLKKGEDSLEKVTPNIDKVSTINLQKEIVRLKKLAGL